MNTDKPRLIDMNPDDAKRVKWELGHAQYGDEFQGHPLEELAAEIIDAMNYCDEAERWGYQLHSLPSHLRMMFHRVRHIYGQQVGKQPA